MEDAQAPAPPEQHTIRVTVTGDRAVIEIAGGGPLPPGRYLGAVVKLTDRRTVPSRDGRCPDGGYCHGSTLAAGSEPCPPGQCFRVTTSGPLSGVFPGDVWPEEVRQQP